MTFTLADLITPLTSAEVEASIYRVLATLGVPTTNWKPGGVARAIVSGVSRVFAAFTALTSSIAQMGWLEYATGSWLTLVALYHYGVTRRAATFAEGAVTLNNTGGGVFEFDAGDLVVTNTSTGKTYANTASVSIGALETGVSANVRAIEAGSGSSAGVGQITSFETTSLGLTVTNPSALVGLDEETDAELKIRCRESSPAVSPDGPRDAYSFFAKRATRSDGTDIGITRVRAIADNDTGVVTCTVATAAGALSGADITETELYLYRYAVPLGVTLDVQNGVEHTIAVTYQVWYRADTGVTAAQVTAAIETALLAFMAARPIGGDLLPLAALGYVYVDAIRAAIGAARHEIFHTVVSAPSIDVLMGSNHIAVLGTVTATATEVTG